MTGDNSTYSNRVKSWNKAVRAQQEKGESLKIGPDCVLEVLRFKIIEIAECDTDHMMEMAEYLETMLIDHLEELHACGNFKDDAGGLVGKRPTAHRSAGGVYLTMLVRRRLFE
eukprot:COSAG02_NODE_6176_length_3735_cov_7.536565_3_plen_113_part_00